MNKFYKRNRHKKLFENVSKSVVINKCDEAAIAECPDKTVRRALPFVLGVSSYKILSRTDIDSLVSNDYKLTDRLLKYITEKNAEDPRVFSGFEMNYDEYNWGEYKGLIKYIHKYHLSPNPSERVTIEITEEPTLNKIFNTLIYNPYFKNIKIRLNNAWVSFGQLAHSMRKCLKWALQSIRNIKTIKTNKIIYKIHKKAKKVKHTFNAINKDTKKFFKGMEQCVTKKGSVSVRKIGKFLGMNNQNRTSGFELSLAWAKVNEVNEAYGAYGSYGALDNANIPHTRNFLET